MYYEQFTKITRLTFTVMPHFYLRTSRVWTPCPSGSRKRKAGRSDSIRSIGFALHQAAMIIPYYSETNPGFVALAKRTVEEVLADINA